MTTPDTIAERIRTAQQHEEIAALNRLMDDVEHELDNDQQQDTRDAETVEAVEAPPAELTPTAIANAARRQRGATRDIPEPLDDNATAEEIVDRVRYHGNPRPEKPDIHYPRRFINRNHR